MLELNRERRTSLVVVTHDLRLAARMERRLEIEQGVLTEKSGGAPVAAQATVEASRRER
jgi:ABC-type lipoprotein export system ATPase subunit